LKAVRAKTPPRERETVGAVLRNGDCVRLSDGRIGRVRKKNGDLLTVRVRRETSDTHQFVACRALDIERIPCPKGWMSPAGYCRYLRATLAKLRRRQIKAGADRRARGGAFRRTTR